jgi:flagellar hook-associated protein 3 FlgL
MRIPNNTITDNALFDVTRTTERLAKAQAAVSSGKVLNRPSDDPNGLAQALSLREALENMEQYQRNVDDAKGFMNTTDSALGTAMSLLRNARVLALQGATDGSTSEARDALAKQVDAIITSLGQLTNATYKSKHIFAGQRTTTPPFVSTPPGYTYQGGSAATGDDTLRVDISQGEAMVINVAGDAVFTDIFSTLTTLRDHIAGGQTGTISRDDLVALDAVMDTVTGLQADFGAKIQRLDQTTRRMDQTKIEFTDLLSKIEDADIPTAVVQLQTAQTAYQAALTATARSFQQTLLDFLR